MAKTPAGPEGPQRNPERGKRFCVYEDGDYLIEQVAPKDAGLPAGTLLQIPEVPHFQSVRAAQQWLRDNGDRVQGMQVRVVKVLRIYQIRTKQTVDVELFEKPRHLVSNPPSE